MSYYWKYSRSGKFSRTYESLIIDVLPNSWSIINNRKIWHTSFEELESFLILLQDIEAINNPTSWTTKKDYIQYVNLLGYSPTTNYNLLGAQFVLGQAQIGRHGGKLLPWGFISDLTTPIDLDVTNLRIQLQVSSTPIKSNDLLAPYRQHGNFINGTYWDYMPMHSCLINVLQAMNMIDSTRTDTFVRTVLRWT